MNNHPIIPSSELINQWETLYFNEGKNLDVVLIQAYQAGAVQIAECGGPCEQGPEHCDCGALAMTEAQAEGNVEDLVAARLRHCPTHGQQPANAWGCPECVRELRSQLKALALAEPQLELPTDEELLQIFDAACLSEGGTTDEIHLRGLRAVLARWGTPN